MDWLTFFSNAIHDLAWPGFFTGLISFVYINRDKVPDIIDRVKYKDIEVYLTKKKLEEAGAAAEEIMEENLSSSASAKSPASPDPEAITHHAPQPEITPGLKSDNVKKSWWSAYRVPEQKREHSPAEMAVIEAWQEILSSLESIPKKHENENRQVSFMVEKLKSEGLLNTSEYELIKSLRAIRNSVVHGSASISVAEAEDYANYSQLLVSKIRSIADYEYSEMIRPK